MKSGRNTTVVYQVNAKLSSSGLSMAMLGIYHGPNCITTSEQLTTDLLILSKYFYLILKIFFQIFFGSPIHSGRMAGHTRYRYFVYYPYRYFIACSGVSLARVGKFKVQVV